MIGEDDQDYWTKIEAPSGSSSEVPTVTRSIIDGVSPLDDQFTLSAPRSVPRGLHRSLFEQAEVIDGQAILPLHTYAVLDGAQILGLAEMLEASGLDQACLFQGQAKNELRDVAPWLVRLRVDHSLTRSLFTKGDANWELWDRQGYILLRSRAGLEQVRHHLRRFTKFEDDNGKWLYFRLYDPTVLHLYLEEADDPYGAGLFDGSQGTRIERFIYRHKNQWYEVASGKPDKDLRRCVDPRAAKRIAVLMAADRELLALKDRGALANAVVPDDQQQEKARSVATAAHRLGFRGRYHLRYFIAWSLVYGNDLDQLQDELQPLWHDASTSIETRFQAISELIRSRFGQRMEALFD